MNVIVEREKGLLELERRINELRAMQPTANMDLAGEVAALESKYAQIQQEVFGSLTPWQRVHMARHPKRPTSAEYVAALDAFDELRGDRMYRDDPAVIAGFAKLRGRRVIVIGQQRGRDTKENLRVNFGMVTPEGYRKIRRLIDLAAHLKLPIVTFVDTKGADPGIGSEERSQSEAIAECLYALTEAPVPIVAAIIGEGGSGGALALALADRVIMLQHSVYSVASPEGAAAILWGDASKAEDAAARLRLTSDDLYGFGIVDDIVTEPLGGAHRDTPKTIAAVIDRIDTRLEQLGALDAVALRSERYARYRRIGSLGLEAVR